MAMVATLLDVLRNVSGVDCDTLDLAVAKNLGPFVDCTSNQAIAYFELSRPVQGETLLHHETFIKEAVQDANDLGSMFPGLPTHELVVDVIMVKLQLLIIPHLSGFIHVQTNPKLAYSRSATIANAESQMILLLVSDSILLTCRQGSSPSSKL
jgi:transaldolase